MRGEKIGGRRTTRQPLADFALLHAIRPTDETAEWLKFPQDKRARSRLSGRLLPAVLRIDEHDGGRPYSMFAQPRRCSQPD